jgi:hypothetical protein
MVPYAVGPAVNFLNSITLQVRVPVLSENMYLICPSSSFRLDDYTPAGISWTVSYILTSYDINWACKNLTISRVTSKEIGTKFLNDKN